MSNVLMPIPPAPFPEEPALSKRMQKFRDERGENACPWPGYWVAEVGKMEAYITDLRAELLKQVINTAQNMAGKLEAAQKTLSETSVPEYEDRPIVKPAGALPNADDPLWEACQKFIMSIAEDPTLGQPGELHFWGLLKIRVYDFAFRALAEARRQGREEAMVERIAVLTAHRVCLGVEHDPEHGKIHGCCVVCGVPWPCEYAEVPIGRDQS